jgi:hypothetical protein
MFHYDGCRLKKKVAMQSRLGGGGQSYHNVGVQPAGDLAARGFSEYRGYENNR